MTIDCIAPRRSHKLLLSLILITITFLLSSISSIDTHSTNIVSNLSGIQSQHCLPLTNHCRKKEDRNKLHQPGTPICTRGAKASSKASNKANAEVSTRVCNKASDKTNTTISNRASKEIAETRSKGSSNKKVSARTSSKVSWKASRKANAKISTRICNKASNKTNTKNSNRASNKAITEIRPKGSSNKKRHTNPNQRHDSSKEETLHQTSNQCGIDREYRHRSQHHQRAIEERTSSKEGDLHAENEKRDFSEGQIHNKEEDLYTETRERTYTETSDLHTSNKGRRFTEVGEPLRNWKRSLPLSYDKTWAIGTEKDRKRGGRKKNFGIGNPAPNTTKEDLEICTEKEDSEIYTKSSRKRRGNRRQRGEDCTPAYAQKTKAPWAAERS